MGFMVLTWRPPPVLAAGGAHVAHDNGLFVNIEMMFFGFGQHGGNNGLFQNIHIAGMLPDHGF